MDVQQLINLARLAGEDIGCIEGIEEGEYFSGIAIRSKSKVRFITWVAMALANLAEPVGDKLLILKELIEEVIKARIYLQQGNKGAYVFLVWWSLIWPVDAPKPDFSVYLGGIYEQSKTN